MVVKMNKYRYQFIADDVIREQITCDSKEDLIDQMNDVYVEDIKCRIRK